MEASKVGALLGPWHSRIWRHQLNIWKLSIHMVFLEICEYMRDEGRVTVESHDYGFESREDRALQRPLPASRGSRAPRATAG